MKKIVSIFAILIICAVGRATHFRSGDITFRHISGYTYEITVTMYYLSYSAATWQRVLSGLSLSWGDNTTWQIPCIEYESFEDYTKTVFRGQHTYPCPGSYVLHAEDHCYSLKTTFTINPNIGSNNSPQLLNNPVFKIPVGQRFVYNLSAFDIDGDNLSYELVIPTGGNQPEASKELYVDPVTGDLVWDAPTKTGTYIILMRVDECRYGLKISSVTRVMQIEVVRNGDFPTVTDMIENEPFKVSPNPTGDAIHFRLEKASIVQLYDSSGKQMIFQRYDAGDIVIHLERFPTGMYILKVDNQAVKILKL